MCPVRLERYCILGTDPEVVYGAYLQHFRDGQSSSRYFQDQPVEKGQSRVVVQSQECACPDTSFCLVVCRLVGHYIDWTPARLGTLLERPESRVVRLSDALARPDAWTMVIQNGVLESSRDLNDDTSSCRGLMTRYLGPTPARGRTCVEPGFSRQSP